MKKKLLLVFAVVFALGASLRAEKVPSFNQLLPQIHKSHPRLFMTPEELPAFKKRAVTVCADLLAEYKKEVDALPLRPKLEIIERNAEMQGDKLVFKRKFGNQNTLDIGLKVTGGAEALKAAILYLATGDKVYRDRTANYLKLEAEFLELADRSGVMTEWYHTSRLAAVVAYDWLYDELTPAERKAFIEPLLIHTEKMFKAGYQTNGGKGRTTGNYGEHGFRWYAGLAAYNDGIDDARALKILRAGYENEVETMDYREKISDGTGLLTSICTGYCFGYYPYSSYNFLHTLKSATGLDGTRIWPQMRDYAGFFYWMAIPAPGEVKDGFYDFGWGDAFHTNNQLASWMMYNHMAQLIHFFGKSDPARAAEARSIIDRLPPFLRTYKALTKYPFLPFILTGFDPEVKAKPAIELFEKQLARNFPSYGLTIMRSGDGADDTYAAFKGGAKYSGHQHYDENSFILYKKGFQALDTGVRDGARHHFAYYPQTVAHNAILIRMPGEKIANYWYPANAPSFPNRKDLPMDGGQYRQEVAKALPLIQDAHFAYTGSDATACYRAEKCREAVRQFVYIAPDYFVVYDRVESVKPDQEKVFLLHFQNEPKFQDGVWRGNAGQGSLLLRTVLPGSVKNTLIGGKDREFETGGVNYPLSPRDAKSLAGKNWLGRYRLEVTPAKAEKTARFLHVLQLADGKVAAMVGVKALNSTTQDGVEFTTAEGKLCQVWFNRNGKVGGKIVIRQNGKVLSDQAF